MFKFVIVLAFVAAAVAEPEPGLLLSSPYVQPYSAFSTVVSPATTSISSQSSSVIHPSPFTYSSPLAFSHFIKKRSAEPQWPVAYSTPYNYFPTSYQYTPSAAVISTPTLYNTPTIASLPFGGHLIKKRSAQLLATPYIASTTYISNPAISPVISTPYLQSPYYGAQLPLVNTHFIKKRSAEPTPEAAPEPSADPQTFYQSSYLAPSPYIKTVTPYLANPAVYSGFNYYPSASAIPLATTHFIKKRSAEATPEAAAEPAAEPAADPQLFRTYPNTYYAGSPLYPSYASGTVIKSSPIYSANPIYPANPFLYSTFIKK